MIITLRPDPLATRVSPSLMDKEKIKSFIIEKLADRLIGSAEEKRERVESILDGYVDDLENGYHYGECSGQPDNLCDKCRAEAIIGANTVPTSDPGVNRLIREATYFDQHNVEMMIAFLGGLTFERAKEEDMIDGETEEAFGQNKEAAIAFLRRHLKALEDGPLGPSIAEG